MVERFLSSMKMYLFFFLFFINIPSVRAEYYIDRVSLKTEPDKACSALFSNTKLIYSTCSGIKFDTTTSKENKAGPKEYRDFLFFFESKNNIKNLATNQANLGMVNTYFVNDKLLSVSGFKMIRKEDIFSLEEDLLKIISDKESELRQELDDLQSSYEKENLELQRKINLTLKDSRSNSKLQEIIKNISLEKFIINETAQLEELKKKISAISLDTEKTQQSPIKAKLSIILKNSIEAALRSK